MRTYGLVLITVSILFTAGIGAQQHDGAPQGAPAEKPQFVLTGDTALLTTAVRPDKVADFERVMRRMRDALLGSSDPARHQQAAGWRIMKMDQPLPDGNVAFVHIIHPVVEGVDYSVMQTLYEAFPNERMVLYELYRGAFVKNLSLATGHIVLEMNQEAAPEDAPANTPASIETLARP